MTRPRAVPQNALALSSLNAAPNGGWPPGARWTTDTDGVGPDSLDLPFGPAVSFRLRNFGGAAFRAGVSLANHGGARSLDFGSAVLTLAAADGRSTKLWSGLIGLGAGRQIDVTLPDWRGEAELRLSGTSAPWRRDGSDPDRIRWTRPTLVPKSTSPPDAMDDRSGRGDGASSGRATATGAPLFSLLTPVHNPEPRILEEMLASVRDQSFADWEHVLIDDASTDLRVIEILERRAAREPRIKLERREVGGGISTATNSALAAASGTYVALLDHDDVLAPEALEAVAAELAVDPEIDMVYSDEDIFDGARRVALFRKPNWSPDLLRSHMYTSHIGVYRRSLAAEVGGFRSNFDGSQDHDFVLRLTELTDRIVHIPRVLYHWRSHAGSAADNPIAKPHAAIAGRNAIADQLRRTEIEAEARFASLRSWYRVDYSTKGLGRVAIVVPLVGIDESDLEYLGEAAESWGRQTEIEVEVVAAGEGSQLDLAVPCLEKALGKHLVPLPTRSGQGRAAIVNRAVEKASAGNLILLDEPFEVLTKNWVSRLSSFAAQPGVGAVGAKVLAPDGSVESAGTVLRAGLPTPVGRHAASTEFGHLALLQVTGNFGAVVGAVAVNHADFEEFDGLREDLDATATVDFSLRAHQHGRRIVGAPDVIVRRLQSTRRPINDVVELERFRSLWDAKAPADPYFNPALAATLTGTDIA
jgi:GT2 family glycosyltransferase